VSYDPALTPRTTHSGEGSTKWVIARDTRHRRADREELRGAPRTAAELVRLKVDMILAIGTSAGGTTQDAITRIPVVFPTYINLIRFTQKGASRRSGRPEAIRRSEASSLRCCSSPRGVGGGLASIFLFLSRRGVPRASGPRPRQPRRSRPYLHGAAARAACQVRVREDRPMAMHRANTYWDDPPLPGLATFADRTSTRPSIPTRC
jgi:hypothetical protein